ncbi:MAG: hypothetical protein V1853_03610 [bacterium]
MLDKRKKNILEFVINEHIKQGKPVGSQQLALVESIMVSSATIRNEMAELEAEGFLHQPHTSAGRVPTELGWRYYLDNLLPEQKLNEKERKFLEKSHAAAKKSGDHPIKALAKALAEVSQDAVMVGFSSNDYYYTGLGNLLTKPEFHSINLMEYLSVVVNHLDEAMSELFERGDLQEINIWVGEEHSFGKDCSVIFANIDLPSEQSGLLGVLGPLRQNYAANIARLKLTKKLLASN